MYLMNKYLRFPIYACSDLYCVQTPNSASALNYKSWSTLQDGQLVWGNGKEFRDGSESCKDKSKLVIENLVHKNFKNFKFALNKLNVILKISLICCLFFSCVSPQNHSHSDKIYL